MTRISQVFNLRDDIDELQKELFGIVKPVKMLVRRLKEKGYDIFIGSKTYHGLPQSLIVAGEAGRPIKDAFFQAATDLGLYLSTRNSQLYQSGEAYTEVGADIKMKWPQ